MINLYCWWNWRVTYMHVSHSVVTECIQWMLNWNNRCLEGDAVAPMVIFSFLILQCLVQSQMTSCWNCDGWSGTVGGFFSSFFGFYPVNLQPGRTLSSCLCFHASSLSQHLVGYRVSTVLFFVIFGPYAHHISYISAVWHAFPEMIQTHNLKNQHG